MKPVVSPAETLLKRLDSLRSSVNVVERRAADPVAFAHAYTNPEDIEIAALFAAVLAFGRVDLFRPVLAKVFAHIDRFGGPRAFVATFSESRDGPVLRPLIYRWTTGVDFMLFFGALQRLLRNGGSLGNFFPWVDGDADVGLALTRGVRSLRDAALAVAGDYGVVADRYEQLPRGFRMLVPSPVDGSACKRWNLFLRWMVHPNDDGVDFGLWTHVPTRALIIPLDTHVARISRLIGLTVRNDDGWKTAVDVTRALSRLHEADPVRYDFAIAHLGISGACIGRFQPTVCPECPLVDVCVARLLPSPPDKPVAT